MFDCFTRRRSQVRVLSRPPRINKLAKKSVRKLTALEAFSGAFRTLNGPTVATIQFSPASVFVEGDFGKAKHTYTL